MIIISGSMRLPAEATDEMRRLTDTLAEATRAEPGNLDYGFWTSASQPGVWHVFERWADQDAIDGHNASAHLAEFFGGVGALGISDVSLVAYDVSAERRLM